MRILSRAEFFPEASGLQIILFSRPRRLALLSQLAAKMRYFSG